MKRRGFTIMMCDVNGAQLFGIDTTHVDYIYKVYAESHETGKTLEMPIGSTVTIKVYEEEISLWELTKTEITHAVTAFFLRRKLTRTAKMLGERGK